MTTTYTFEQLKEDVKKEAEALRVHATQEERERLDIEMLDPSSSTECIYGLMTDSCFSKRAALLINQCCKRFFTNSVLPDSCEEYSSMDKVQKAERGQIVYEFVKGRTGAGMTYYSAIEAYILLPEAKNANLIAYLKGETDTLEL